MEHNILCVLHNRDEWPMIKKIEILGIRLDNYTVKEAMLKVEEYLNNTVMNTIEAISMEMLVRAKEDELLRESIESLDLAIVDEKEILLAAGVDTVQRIRETVEKQFFKEFMKRIVRNGKTVYLFGETKQQLEKLKEFLSEDYGRLKIAGSYALEDCAGDYDGVVNEINIASPDIVFSVLPTPGQEYFLAENKEKMNAKVWYGLGDNYAGARGINYIRSLAKKILHKGMMRSMLSKYDKK